DVGCLRAWVFASITLPLALPGIITGSLLSFARGLGEFGAPITFVSNIPGETETLPLELHSLTPRPGAERAAWGEIRAHAGAGGRRVGAAAQHHRRCPVGRRTHRIGVADAAVRNTARR